MSIPPYPPIPPDYASPAEAYPYPASPPFPAPYPAPYPGYPGFPGYGYPPRPTNALSIAALVSAFLCSPLAIIFGHVSLCQIKRSGEQGRGMAIAGLVIGYLVTIGTIVLLVAGMFLARLARDAAIAGGAGIPGGVVVMPATPERSLPNFTPPVGLGFSCSYPATTTAARPVKPPRGGKVSLDPAVIAATVTTNDGTVGLSLDNAKAPCTVNSFVSLARQGYFDNTRCHRLTTGPAMGVLQCGDPNGDGSGGPGYRFDNEYPTNQYRKLDPALSVPLIYPRGTLAMANSGPNSNGSQFFIVYRDSKLPPTYTVFGRVDAAGLATVDRLASVGVSGGADDGMPASPITIRSLTVN